MDDVVLEWLRVDKSSGTPAFLQLKRQLEGAVHSGQLQPGAALPSERVLAAQLGVARMTVRRAYEVLVEVGLVEQRRGAGTFVRGLAVEGVATVLGSFSHLVRCAGFEPGDNIISFEQVEADQGVAEALGVAARTQILRLLRLRTADGAPLELQDTYLPPRFLPLSIVGLTQSGSLYASLEQQFGERPLRGHQTVGARLATSGEGRYLKLNRDVPVLTKRRVTYGLDGRTMEFTFSVARSDRLRLVFQVE